VLCSESLHNPLYNMIILNINNNNNNSIVLDHYSGQCCVMQVKTRCSSWYSRWLLSCCKALCSKSLHNIICDIIVTYTTQKIKIA